MASRKAWDFFQLTDGLRIPPEILRGEARVTISGNQRVWVEHCRGILTFTENALILQGKRGKIIIEGKRLVMEYYTREDLVVRGTVRTVQYEMREGGS